MAFHSDPAPSLPHGARPRGLAPVTTRQAVWLIMVSLAVIFTLLSLLLAPHSPTVPHHPPHSIWMVQ